MAGKKAIKPVEEVKQVEVVKVGAATCASCKWHTDRLAFYVQFSKCERAAQANNETLITGHSGVLYTADTFGCNQFEGKG